MMIMHVGQPVMRNIWLPWMGGWGLQKMGKLLSWLRSWNG